MKIFFLFLLSLCWKGSFSHDFDEYLCGLCKASAGKMEGFKTTTLMSGCLKQFSADICDLVFGKQEKSLANAVSSTASNHIEFCQELAFCSSEVEQWQLFDRSTFDGIDVRVSRAIGSRGYDKMRISVISNYSVSSPIYSYSAQFKYRWTTHFLNTGIVTVAPGVKTTVQVADGKTIDVFLPVEDAGVRGVILADPCFTSQYVTCAYKDTFNTFNRTIELLNAINAHDDVHFWQILGDNFYDQDGAATATWFQALSDSSKSKIFATVPGNHDFWVNGSPSLWTSKDQQGNGFAQFYGQDVIAAIKSEIANVPLDFSVDPDVSKGAESGLPPASNFFFYNKVGNLGFIGYSGAHSFESMEASFNEACAWASEANLQTLLLLGHWNSAGMGCASGSTVPDTYGQIKSLPACAPVAAKMKYFMGHTHCNVVTSPDLGFMVAAGGMSDSNTCGATYGLAFIDSTQGAFNVYNFDIAINNAGNKVDNYDKILSCINAKGLSGCYNLAELWSSTPY